MNKLYFLINNAGLIASNLVNRFRKDINVYDTSDCIKDP